MSAKSKLYLTTFDGYLKFAKVKIKCISKYYETFTIWCLSIPKYVMKIQNSLKSDKSNGFYMWRPMYLYEDMSFSSS
jgi:hypothetical protein